MESSNLVNPDFTNFNHFDNNPTDIKKRHTTLYKRNAGESAKFERIEY